MIPEIGTFALVLALLVALVQGTLPLIGAQRGVPAWIGLAECDPLVDEGVEYADKLRMAGVPVDLEIYKGVTHEFVKMGRVIAEARQAAIEAVAQLNRDVNIPARLRDVGMKEEDIDALAAAALAGVCTGGNPRDTSLEEIKALYRQIF